MAGLERRFPLYARLLRLYPAVYRKAYAQQTLQTLADMLDDAPKRTQRLAVWTRIAIDFPVTMTREQIKYTGGIMARETPHYVKRNAVLSGALLVPFFLAIGANAIDKIMNGQTLYTSWPWAMPILALWVLWLPLAATVIASSSLIYYQAQRIRTASARWGKALLEVQYSWPLLIVLCSGLFILAVLFGHDSVHCVTGNPVREFQNWHQTWRCIQQR